jgi:hypothetical protein
MYRGHDETGMYRTNWPGPGTSGAASGDGADGIVTGVVAGVVSVGILVVAFGALALGVDAWWLAFPFGYGGVLPLAVGLARWRTSSGRSHSSGATADGRPATTGATRSADTEEAALATLRQRYAEGEMDEVEFEHRVETLLREADAGQTGDRGVDVGTGERSVGAGTDDRGVDASTDDR